MLSQTSAVFTKLLTLGIYTAVVSHIALIQADSFWTSLPGWLLALVFYDFCYYWLHRMGHEVGVLWAAHSVHHQSQAYNLSTALRQTSSGALLGWVFYLPMALAGVPPLVFAVVGLIDLLYQFWVHTEQVKKLGWFDRWFCAPSNHRVHHAVNDRYLDKNYGGILIIWDRLFGTYKTEDDEDPCVYGTRGLLQSWDPLWANATVYRQLAHDSWHARNWLDKARVWFKPPGWRPADVAQRFPKPAFDLDEHRIIYAPPMSQPLRWFAGLLFAALVAGTSVFLWHADQSPLATNLIWFGVLLTGQWALGAAMQGRISLWMALMLQSGALATATAALGLREWHWLFKPATMVFALICIASCASSFSTSMQRASKSRRYCWLSLSFFTLRRYQPDAGGSVHPRPSQLSAGSPLLSGAVQAGCALVPQPQSLAAGCRHRHRHVCLPLDPWSAHRAAPACGSLCRRHCPDGRPGLGPLSGTGSAPCTSGRTGRQLFMLSDSVLAINRFAQPLPWSAIWVLLTYYAAQALIVQGVLRHSSRPSAGAAAHQPAPLEDATSLLQPTKG